MVLWLHSLGWMEAAEQLAVVPVFAYGAASANSLTLRRDSAPNRGDTRWLEWLCAVLWRTVPSLIERLPSAIPDLTGRCLIASPSGWSTLCARCVECSAEWASHHDRGSEDCANGYGLCQRKGEGPPSAADSAVDSSGAWMCWKTVWGPQLAVGVTVTCQSTVLIERARTLITCSRLRSRLRTASYAPAYYGVYGRVE